jgi:hypothetical protein
MCDAGYQFASVQRKICDLLEVRFDLSFGRLHVERVCL